MVTTVTDNSPQSINTSLFSLDKEVQEVKKTADALNDKLSGIDTESGVISVNGKQGIVELNASDVKALPDTTVIPTTTSELTNNSGFITINDVGSSFVPVTRKVNNKQLNTDITLTASDVGALPNTTVIPTKTSQLTNDSGFITSSDSITGNAATATTADNANAPTGFVKGRADGWGNQDGESITDWETVKDDNNNHGDIAFRFNNGQVNVKINGVFYQNEGLYKLVDENSIKTIMKPNYTTGRFPAGKYGGGETVTVSATITTTRGNPVFISYSGDFNSVDSGDTVPWVSFNLYADDVLIQRTVVDNSTAFTSDNTPFAGNALAALSAGSHTIRLDAVLTGTRVGKIEFQEQENYVNLVAFEL